MNMIVQIIEIIFPVFIIALAGYVYAKKTNISMDITNKINMAGFWNNSLSYC